MDLVLPASAPSMMAPGRPLMVLTALAVNRPQIELAEPVRVVEDVNLGDLPAADRERHDGERLSIERANQSRGAVDERWEPEHAEAGKGQCCMSHLLRTAEFPRSAWQLRTGVDSEDYIRIEDSDEPVEVTIPCSRDEGIDNASLNFYVGIRSGVARLNAATRAAGQLASRIGGALHDGCNLLEGHVEDVVQHERDAFGGRERLDHHQQCETDRIAQQCFMLGAHSVSAVDDQIRHASLAPRLA